MEQLSLLVAALFISQSTTASKVKSLGTLDLVVIAAHVAAIIAFVLSSLGLGIDMTSKLGIMIVSCSFILVVGSDIRGVEGTL